MNVNLTATSYPMYKINLPQAPITPPPAAPTNAAPPQPAPSQDKPWWQKAAEGFGLIAAGAFKGVMATPIAALATVADGGRAGVKTAGELFNYAGQDIGTGLGEIYHAGDTPQPQAAPAPTTTPKLAPLADAAPVMAYGGDLKSATDINNFCWHAAKLLLGRKPNWSEVNAWREQIQRQGLDKEGALALIAQHGEAQKREAKAASMLAAFKEAFGRDMSAEERDFYSNHGIESLEPKAMQQKFADVKNDLDAGIINGDPMLDQAAALALQATNPAGLNAKGQKLVLDVRAEQAFLDAIAVDGKDTMADPGDAPVAR